MSSIVAELIPTPRLDLVPLRVDHADEMVSVLADPVLYTYIGGQPPAIEDLRLRYERVVAGSPDPAVVWCNWVIRLREADCLVGMVEATISAGDDVVAEIAWVVGRPWQGNGIATEAALALVDWLRHFTVTTVVAHIHPRHRASAAVAAAAGLIPTGQWKDGERRWRVRLTRPVD